MQFQFQAKNAVIFARVSSSRQATPENISLESQLFDCMNYAKLHNYNILSTHTEIGSAFKSRKNSRLEQMIGEIEKSNNKQKIDKFIVYSFDRFSRNALVGLTYLERLKKFGITVESVIEQINSDSPNGRHQLTILLSTGQLYSEVLGLKSKKAKEYKKSIGNYVGRTSFGYITQVLDDRRILVKDENEQQLIQFIVGLREGLLTSAEATKIISCYIEKHNYAPIEFYDGDKKISKLRPYGISYADIANLLNDYQVFRRNNKWTAATVSAICKKFGNRDITTDLNKIVDKIDRIHIDSSQASQDKYKKNTDIMKTNKKRLKKHVTFSSDMDFDMDFDMDSGYEQKMNDNMEEDNDESIFDLNGKIKDLDSDGVSDYDYDSDDDILFSAKNKKKRFSI